VRNPFTSTLLVSTLSPLIIRVYEDFGLYLLQTYKCEIYSLDIAFLIHYLDTIFCRTPSKYKGSRHFILFYTSPALYTYILYSYKKHILQQDTLTIERFVNITFYKWTKNAYIPIIYSMTSEWNPQFTIHTKETVHLLFGIISWYVFASEQISHNCFKFFPHFLYFMVTSECFPPTSLYLMSSIHTSSLAWALFCGKHSPSFPKYKWTLSAFRFHYKWKPHTFTFLDAEIF